MRQTGRILSPLLLVLFLTVASRAFSQDAISLFNVGLSAYNDGLYTTAINNFERLIKYYPSFTRNDYAEYLLSVSYFHVGEYKRCIDSGALLIEDFPDSDYVTKVKYWIGVSYYRLGRYDKAFQYLTAMLGNYRRKDSFLVLAMYYRALSLEKMGKLEGSISLFESLENLESVPLKRSIEKNISYEIAGLYFRLGRYGKARSYYRKILVDYPDSPFVESSLFFSAECSFLIGDKNDAEKRYSRYIDLFEKGKYRDTALYRLALLSYERGKQRSALSFTKAIRRGEDKKFQYLVDKLEGDIQYDLGNYAKASILYEGLATDREMQFSSAERAKLYYNLGLSLEKSGKSEKALSYLKRAIQLGDDPTVEKARLEIALILLADKNYDEAEGELKKLSGGTSSRDIRETAMKNLALLYDERGETKKSYLTWKKLAELFYDSKDLESYLFSEAMQAIKLQLYAESLEALERIVEKDKTSKFFLESLYEIGYVYSMRGEYSRATGYFERVMNEIRQNESKSEGELYAKTAYALGAAYFNTGREEEAIRYFDLAGKSRNNDVAGEAFFNKAMIFLKKEDYKNASTALDSAISNFTNEKKKAQSFFWKGWARFRMQDYEGAEEIFLKTSKNYPFVASNALYMAALSAHQHSRYQRAVNYVKSALSSLPKYEGSDLKDLKLKILYEKVLIFIDMSELGKAERVTEILLGDYGNSDLTGEALFKLASAFYGKDDFNRAYEIFGKIVKHFHGASAGELSLYWMGMSALELGRYSEAIDSFLGYLNGYPKGSLVDAAIGGIRKGLEASGDEKLIDRVYELAEKSSKMAPKLKASIFLQYARYILFRKPEKSFAILNKLLSEGNLDDPMRAEAQYGIALYYEEKGKLERALDILTGIAEARSDRIGAKAQLEKGRVYEKLDMEEKAVESYVTLTYLFPDYRDEVVAALKSAIALYKKAGKDSLAEKLTVKLNNLQ